MDAFFDFIYQLPTTIEDLQVNANASLNGKEMTDSSRHKFLDVAAEGMGLTCFTYAELQLIPLIEDFRICKLSNFQPITCRNLITAETDIANIMLFDLGFSRLSNDVFKTEQTVGLIQCSDFDLPNFDLEPLNSKVLSGYRFEKCNIDFLNDPLFSNVYRLRGNDGNGVRKYFDPTLREHLIDMGGIYLEGKGDLLLYCFPGSLMAPRELKDFFSHGFELMQYFTRTDINPECVAKTIKSMLD